MWTIIQILILKKAWVWITTWQLAYLALDKSNGLNNHYGLIWVNNAMHWWMVGRWQLAPLISNHKLMRFFL